ncbi:MAG: TM0106 family RecB-like putative nuclease, partial [Bacteroidetes bacterium]|nr:TM0106 family RecB-like putative nuclease [Bacteroidota bacterium]
MKKISNGITFSASDLSNHHSCGHSTVLDLFVAQGVLEKPNYYDPTVEALQQRGLEFEQGYLNELRAQGLVISEPKGEESDAVRTLNAMQSGVDIIYQATLGTCNWQGRADFLRRIDGESSFGAWSYEVIDTKLAKETKAGTILQISLYSQLVADLQGSEPQWMHVMTPGNGYSARSYRTNDFTAYFHKIKKRLGDTIIQDNGNTYPHPVEHCGICRWWQHCDKKRREDDHLSYVAGIKNSQIAEMSKWTITTLTGLADLPLPLTRRPDRGAIQSYIKIREQARVQHEARNKGTSVYELLPLLQETGLFKLPEPSKGDIFFDFEGDPFAGTSGLEYLFGWVLEAEDEYHRTWALNPTDERAAFESFVDRVMERWETYPDMHIYHYSAYEPSALKRLMGKYATREDEVDKMLRGGLFVDMLSITKQAIRAGVESYSLKELEIFHDFKREKALQEVSRQLRAFERLIESGNAKNVPAELIAAIEIYNKEDCLSTKALKSWLEKLRDELIQQGYEIPRPPQKPSEPSEGLTEYQERLQELYGRLTVDLPPDVEERNHEQQAQWILAHMLDWYRREKKAAWWEYFRLRELPSEELLEEKAAISGLQFTGQREIVKRSVVDTYSFPFQDCDIRAEEVLKTQDGKTLGSVVEVDTTKHQIKIKKGPTNAENHPEVVFKNAIINDLVKAESIYRLAEWVAANGISSGGQYRAGRDLLLRISPRITGTFERDIDPQQLALNWVQVLDQGVLPIQGPPGTGKSHTAANMIVALVRAGKKVGITALSHKVIRNLLEKVVKVALSQQFQINCVQKASTVSTEPNPNIIEVSKNEDVLNSLQSGQVQVAAGTSWLWAREEFYESVDVLFVDEAGQLSLIDTLAVSQAARNLVLLGDPQQLKQPQQGGHPEGTEVSALEHILNGRETIAPDAGIFLGTTWRLHPHICGFNSELFYENRLAPRPELTHQLVTGDPKIQGAGLWFAPVPHEGNQSASIEESRRVVEIVEALTCGEVIWTDSHQVSRTLHQEDIMVIAPYNAQVALLQSRLPAAVQVGTVDKFQGQEAPVVIFSMATSTPEDAPRGMEFLYSPNRLNVAVSRARSACILVANPQLFEPVCKTPGQMKLANAFCRYL